MIAYIGKDRQDAIKTKLIDSESVFAESEIGKYNAAIINNLIVNIVENSYGKDFIQLDEKHYQALKTVKKTISVLYIKTAKFLTYMTKLLNRCLRKYTISCFMI